MPSEIIISNPGLETVEEGDYGYVVIRDGEYAGRTGYYDDDEYECAEDEGDDEDDERGITWAIVYLDGPPTLGRAIYCSHNALRPATEAEEKAWADVNQSEAAYERALTTNRSSEEE